MPDSRPTLRQARADAARRLADVSDTPDLDAELLLREVLGVSRAGLFLRDPEPLTPADEQRYRDLVEHRLAGEPVAYILGRKGFRAIELFVDRRVLVPRPETEQLVELALAWLRRRPGPRRVIDVGTGSGAIALSLTAELGERRDVEIVATDVSSDALDVARLNRERLGLDERVRLVASDLLAGVDGRFDLILANLPYLRSDQRHPTTAHEPPSALFAGDDGFDLYRAFFRQIPAVLARDGLVIAEIDPGQAEFGAAYAEAQTGLPVRVERDAAGRQRLLLAGSWDGKTGA